VRRERSVDGILDFHVAQCGSVQFSNFSFHTNASRRARHQQQVAAALGNKLCQPGIQSGGGRACNDESFRKDQRPMPCYAAFGLSPSKCHYDVSRSTGLLVCLRRVSTRRNWVTRIWFNRCRLWNDGIVAMMLRELMELCTVPGRIYSDDRPEDPQP